MATLENMSAEEFYSLRDARTRTLLDASPLANSRVNLSIDHKEAETLSGQTCFLLLVNLNVRWCRQVVVAAPDVQIHPRLSHWGGKTLLESALAIASAADPFGHFLQRSTSAATASVHVGAGGPADAFPVAGRGWLAYAGRPLVEEPYNGADLDNALGATLAAAVGTAHAIRRSLGHDSIFAEAKLSLWNFGDGPDAVDGPRCAQGDLGKLLIVGAGAIGSTIAYLLPLLQLRPSTVDLIDGDRVDYPNLNRAPMFFARDVDLSKIEVAAEYLLAAGIDSRSMPEWFGVNPMSLNDYDLVVPAANEPDARSAIMHRIPPLMVSGSTGAHWDAYRQRHIPVKDDCLICRFPMRQSAPKLMCATGEIEPALTAESEPQTAGLPFLSLAGAAMAVADIARLGFDGYADRSNYTSLWFSGSELRFTNANRKPKHGCSYCVCPEIFQAVRKIGQFNHYSTL